MLALKANIYMHMNDISANQAYLFIVYLICGVIIGVFFDIFRILRKSFKTSDFITYIEDIIFGILTGIFLIFMLFIFNNGELRFFIFLAMLLGMAIYLLTISKYFIKLSVNIIVIIKKLIIKIISILLYPIKKTVEILKKHVLKSILRPFRILTINIKNIKMTKETKAKNKLSKKDKIKTNKKNSSKKAKLTEKPKLFKVHKQLKK